MATIGNSFLNMIDALKMDSTTADVGMVAEVLARVNPILQDANMIPANMGTIHRHTIRTGLPAVAWGRIYQGIPQSKSTVQQVDDTTGYVEGLSTVATELLRIAKNPAALRLSEGQSFLEAMSQELNIGFFYHDTATTPEKIKGLAARYSSLTAGQTASQMVSAAGAGSDNTSIWFCTWGDHATSLIHPENIPGGITREDKGEQRVLDAAGNPYYVKEELFQQHVGVAVRDWRYNARICNIDVSNVAAGSVDLYKFMRKAYYKLQGRRVAKLSGDVPSMGRTVIYMNRDMLEALDGLATNGGSADNFTRLRPMEIQGEEVMSYRGIPIRETDALVNTETVVS